MIPPSNLRLGLLWLCGCLALLHAVRPPYGLHYSVLRCTANDAHVADARCLLQPPQGSHIFAAGTIAQEITALSANITILSTRPLSQRAEQLFVFEADVCKLLMDGTKNKLLDMFYESFRKTGDFPKSCPMRKGRRVTINHTINLEPMPRFMPEMKFSAYITYYVPPRVEVFQLYVEGRLGETAKTKHVKPLRTK